MAKKHSLFKTLLAGLAALYASNLIIDRAAKEKKMCSSNKGRFYSFREGEIYYTKHGEGSPVLLIHQMDPCSSSYEWSKVYYPLSKNHTVYCLDLLGCGQSDKPQMTYTNYLYVQLIRDFVRDMIKEKTDLVVSADSASFVVMANHLDPSLFDRVILINPCDPKKMSWETTPLQMVIKKILFLPLIGNSLYNYFVSEKKIRRKFVREYFYGRAEERYVMTYYQSAHAKYDHGRYLYASKTCNYTNIDMSIGLKEKTNLFMIESEQKHAKKIVENYQKINDKIHVTYLSKANLLPQLEKEDFSQTLAELLEK